MNIIEAIQSRIPGVSVTGSGLNVKVNIRGAANFSGAIDPLYILDGIPTDLQQLTSISVNDVESVDVLKVLRASAFGSRATGGVLCVYTKRGNKNYDWTKDKTPGMKGSKIMGLKLKNLLFPKI